MGKLSKLIDPKILKATEGANRIGGPLEDATTPNTFDVFDEYAQSTATVNKEAELAADASGGGAGAKAARDEVTAKELEQAEAARVVSVSPETKVADWNAQVTSPEEFGGRVQSLTDQSFAVNAIENGRIDANIADPRQYGMEIGEKYKVWEVDQAPVLAVVRSNDELMQWGKEGAYTRGRVFGENVENPGDPVVFYRMDIRADPRADLSPIQFDPNANQFGMHLGSKKAGGGIITPQGIAANKDKMTRIRGMFDELANKDPRARQLYDEALAESRTNMFLRYGEDPFATPNKAVFDELVDDFFNELKALAKEKGARGLAEIENVDAFKTQLSQAMRLSLDPVQHPVMTNVKKGLFVQDLGPKNTAAGIAENLQGRGIFPDDELEAILGMQDNAAQNVALRDMLREDGYDHLVYVNNGEDNGVISIVLFDEANYQNLYKPTMGRHGQPTGHQVATNSAYDVIAAGTRPSNVTQLPESVKELDFIGQNNLEQVAAISQKAIPRYLKTLNDPKSSAFAVEQAQEKLSRLADDMREWGRRAMKNGATEEDIANAQKGILPEPPTPLTEADVMGKASRNAEVHRMSDEVAFQRAKRDARRSDPDLTEAELVSVGKDHVRRIQENRKNMADYTNGVNDLYIESTLHGAKKGKQRVEMLMNPTELDFQRWHRKHFRGRTFDEGWEAEVRVITDVEGNYYIWDAEDALHDDVIKKTGMRYNYDDDFTDVDGIPLDLVFGTLRQEGVKVR